MNPTIRIKRLDPRAILPAYHSELAAGLDIAALLETDDAVVTIEPRRIVMIRTGWAMSLPVGFEAQVRPRSGLGFRHAITLPNAPGTIDADYRGEVSVPLINLGTKPFEVTHAMRIAQMIVAPVAHARVEETDALDATDRGENGFGSTGIQTRSRHPGETVKRP